MSETEPDYATLEPPDATPPTEYTTTERRAEILRIIIEAGTPAAVTQTDLADRYGVHDSTISRDMDCLREYAAKALGRDATLTTKAVFEKTVRELQADGEWQAAWDVVMDWGEWLAARGAIDTVPDAVELEADVTTREASRETDEYVLLTDDEAVHERDAADGSGGEDADQRPALGAAEPADDLPEQ